MPRASLTFASPARHTHRMSPSTPYAQPSDSTSQRRRPLIGAMALSLFLHGLLLLPGAGPAPLHSSGNTGGQVQARLQSPPAQAPRPPSPPDIEPQQPAPARQAEERSYPSSPPNPDATPAQPPRNGASTSHDPAQPPAFESPDRAIDIAGLREYHLALGRTASQFRHYPPAARAAGQQGRVALRLAIGENNQLLGISLIGSSQYPELDQAALDMLRLTAAHTPVPESLRGRNFTIDLAIDFKPDDPP
ncbi:MAG: TonB family protein [Rhodocyclales bacterium GT-UBC]|nr:MAG: TonB family protein [Rhodocyclales bacterium GT-UBC]